MNRLYILSLLLAVSLLPLQAHASSVARSFSAITAYCGPVNVTLTLAPTDGATYCLIDDMFPSGWNISDFSGSGNTQQAGHIKWIIGDLNSRNPLQASRQFYEIVFPNQTGTFAFTGSFSCEFMKDGSGNPRSEQVSGERNITIACTDTDRDGVPDAADRCAGTPSSTTDSAYRPNTTSFDIASDLTGRNLRRTPFRIGKSDKAVITFLQDVDLAPVDASGCLKKTDIQRSLTIERNAVGINTTALRNLNVPANITFLNVTFAHPVVLRDGSPCPKDICHQNMTTSRGTNVTIFVTRFSSYSLAEAGQCAEGQISGICLCGPSLKDYGYCCSGSWQQSACPGNIGSGNDGGGAGGGGDGGAGGGGDTPAVKRNECERENLTRTCGGSKGLCTPGKQACVSGPEGLRWGECLGQVGPYTEICNGMDDDCDGTADSAGGKNLSCECSISETKPCGSNIGVCSPGRRECANGKWGECLYTQSPFEEICGDGLDNDCDSEIDEGPCLNVSSTMCNDGAIPVSGCVCGGSTRTGGFCYADQFSESSKEKEFPWPIVMIFGVILLLVLTMEIIYREFYKSHKNLTWDLLRRKYSDYFHSFAERVIEPPEYSAVLRPRRRKRKRYLK